MIEPLREEDYGVWDAFVEESSDGTLFHTIAWKRILEETFGYQPYYFILRDAKGGIAGIFPAFLVRGIHGKVLVSLPFMEYGGPIVRDGYYASMFESIVNLFVMLKKEQGVRYLEIKTPPDTQYHDAESFLFAPVVKAYDYSINIGGRDFTNDFWPKMKAKTRVRHSVVQSCRYGVGVADADIHSFYALHVSSMARVGSLPWPQRFFANIRTYYPASRFIGAYIDKKMIGAMLNLPYRARDLAVVLSYDRSCQAYRASDLLYYHEIRFAFENRFATVDFGRTRPDSPYEKYKQKWGATKHTLYSYVYPADMCHLVDPYASYTRFARFTRNNIAWNAFVHTFFGQNAIRYFP
ncbi:MAG: hypothetical protein UX61_C0009G0005 [Parcubacteria group bacterium GW2011_GWA2_46_7]|nr:MAG: hypothetical protein UX15_C0019G0004 [Parcubacteria group bacterium GW2011_GWA1_45_7]KKU11201.1 MAG: hypothetical protein UX14_C0001G0020 [Parcubacteria group bacterium GW2011_GWF1_45_5]KKU43866.1 MAG: hypothetical protein UX61_C0009G0005 [Parcubacteria group bacterium GW2011_GWA2_46_7]